LTAQDGHHETRLEKPPPIAVNVQNSDYLPLGSGWIWADQSAEIRPTTRNLFESFSGIAVSLRFAIFLSSDVHLPQLKQRWLIQLECTSAWNGGL
jgi:hypothetical protein